MAEEFRPIANYENYFVSNLGRVKKDDKIIKSSTNAKTGYLGVNLYGEGTHRYTVIHQLVCRAFNPNPNPDVLTEVDHIDRNKTNNCSSNLRWVSRSENLMNRKGYSNTGKKFITFINNKYILQLNGSSVYCKQFKSLEEALNARRDLLISRNIFWTDDYDN